MQDTRALLLETTFPAIQRQALTTLQVNLGYLCNLSCTHCHVNAGPTRTELMGLDTINLVLEVLRNQNIKTLDLTGGAPEMNPHFSYLVTTARRLGVEVIDRCNLTILLEEGFEHLAEFMAEQQVCIVASLPCYSEQNVAEQRGKGIFEQSIEAIKVLNNLGYGQSKQLSLHLVYNPNGDFLPPAQQQLEAQYKQTLFDEFGLVFNQLFTITNMPISRFGAQLLARGNFQNYMGLLKENFTQQNLSSVMCRDLISVDWQGNLYDCDFNQMLELPLFHQAEGVIGTDRNRHLSDLQETSLTGQPIIVGEHCYGCTAGQGSSCGGALG